MIKKFLLLALLLIPSVTLAAGTPTPIFPQTIRAYKVQLNNATGTTTVTVASGATNGTKINSVVTTSTDSASNTIVLYVTRGAVTYLLGAFSLPASAGNAAGTPAVNLLSSGTIVGLPVDSDGNPYLLLESTDTLQVSVTSAITAGRVVNVVTNGGDF